MADPSTRSSNEEVASNKRGRPKDVMVLCDAVKSCDVQMVKQALLANIEKKLGYDS